MFAYKDLTDAQIDELENSDVGELAAANLMIIHGLNERILTIDEGLKQLHNISLAIMNIEAD